jgi:hypothetical protein
VKQHLLESTRMGDDGRRPPEVDEQVVRRWICVRAHQLGWTEALFEQYDEGPLITCERMGSHRIERIGKKYQCIALAEVTFVKGKVPVQTLEWVTIGSAFERSDTPIRRERADRAWSAQAAGAQAFSRCAARAGEALTRSTAQQVEHWARIGQAVESAGLSVADLVGLLTGEWAALDESQAWEDKRRRQAHDLQEQAAGTRSGKSFLLIDGDCAQRAHPRSALLDRAPRGRPARPFPATRLARPMHCRTENASLWPAFSAWQETSDQKA